MKNLCGYLISCFSNNRIEEGLEENNLINNESATEIILQENIFLKKNNFKLIEELEEKNHENNRLKDRIFVLKETITITKSLIAMSESAEDANLEINNELKEELKEKNHDYHQLKLENNGLKENNSELIGQLKKKENENEELKEKSQKKTCHNTELLFENYQLKSENNELKDRISGLKEGTRMTETLLGLSEDELDTSLQENNKLKKILEEKEYANKQLLFKNDNLNDNIDILNIYIEFQEKSIDYNKNLLGINLEKNKKLKEELKEKNHDYYELKLENNGLKENNSELIGQLKKKKRK